MLSVDLKEAIGDSPPRHSPCFSVLLFRLMLKADRSNFSKLASSYPAHAKMVYHWQGTGEILKGVEEYA